LLHDIRIKGQAFDLRPISVGDAAFIVELRTDPQLSRFMTPSASTVADQVLYFERYFRRVGDYYFIVERQRDGRSEGAVALHSVEDGNAESSRWVLRHGSLAAVDSALGILTVAFEELRLNRIWCRTMADNLAVLSCHDSCGLSRTGRPLSVEIDGRRRDEVEHELTRFKWPPVRDALSE
jgi:RimJ/RimL family protein N-acetyltransferase